MLAGQAPRSSQVVSVQCLREGASRDGVLGAQGTWLCFTGAPGDRLSTVSSTGPEIHFFTSLVHAFIHLPSCWHVPMALAPGYELGLWVDPESKEMVSRIE